MLIKRIFNIFIVNIVLFSNFVLAVSTVEPLHLHCPKSSFQRKAPHKKARFLLIMNEIKFDAYSKKILRFDYPDGFSEAEKEQLTPSDKDILESISISPKITCSRGTEVLGIKRMQNIYLLPQTHSVYCHRGEDISIEIDVKPEKCFDGIVGFTLITLVDEGKNPKDLKEQIKRRSSDASTVAFEPPDEEDETLPTIEEVDEGEVVDALENRLAAAGADAHDAEVLRERHAFHLKWGLPVGELNKFFTAFTSKL
jgi:hypothetical protein